MDPISLLDYGAGNVRSVRNAIKKLGFTVEDITTPEDVLAAKVIVFPGVGSFGHAMDTLNSRGLVDSLRTYLAANRPFFGICLGLQTLFEGSEESPGVAGLGIIPGFVSHFRSNVRGAEQAPAPIIVPHIGWNGLKCDTARTACILSGLKPETKVYFVHSYRVPVDDAYEDWTLSTTDYCENCFVSSIQKGNIIATQFHPEKSGEVGLQVS